MKKNLLVAAVLVAMTASSFAQGTVTFNAGSGKLKYSTDGSTLVSAPAGVPPGVGSDTIGTFGRYNVAIYSASLGTSLSGDSSTAPTFGTGWTLANPIATAMGPGAGGSPSITVTMGAGAAGVDVQMEIVGWTGTYTDFASALAAAQLGNALIGWAGSTLSGGAFSWDNATGTSSTAAALVTGTSGFNGLVLAPVPEPTTLALGGLGAATLLLLRRRK